VKVKAARSLLSVVWVVGSVPLIVIVALQSFNQVYGDMENWDKGWLWIMPLLFPVLGTIIGSWSVGHNESDNLEISSGATLWLTVLLSAVYFVIFYSALITGSLVYKHNNWDFIMRSTGWFLGMFQALITIALTKFFIENIHPAPSP
jgi:cellobiose-specific phosphotransferase system component IIC